MLTRWMGDAARIIICNAIIDEILSKKLVEKTVSITLPIPSRLISNIVLSPTGSSWHSSL